MRVSQTWSSITITLALVGSACGDDDSLPDGGIHPDATLSDGGPRDGGQDTGPTDRGQSDGETVDGTIVDAGEVDAGPIERNPDCDSIMPEVCALPWPSNLYLETDASRATGYTLAFRPTSLPKNDANPSRHISGDAYRDLDGYGLATPIMMLFPNVDGSVLPNELEVASSTAADAEIQLYQASGGELLRIPYFVDWDLSETDPAKRLLIVRPAVLLEEASRYVVVVRGLVDLNGAPIQPSEDFARLVAGETAGDPLLAPRQARFDEIFALIESETSIERGELLLAWDFVTGSSEGLHGRMLHMIDTALGLTGADGPELTITYTGTVAPDGRADPAIAYDIEGTFEVPNFLEPWTFNGWQHTVLRRDSRGRPQASGTRSARFWARIPRSALSSTVTVGLLMHGHGQLGSGSQIYEVRSARYGQFANRHHYILFACDMIGMSEAEEVPLGVALGDFTGFKWIGDTLHQGMLEHVLLARAMRERFADLPAIQNMDLRIDANDLRYYGISQGGIFGASVVALSPDIDRGHLGVGGVSYGNILARSRNFRPFFERLSTSYGDSRDQAILVALAQLLFDGTESVSYLRRIHNPLPGRTEKRLLIALAKGDYQVPPLTNEVVGRTVEVQIPYMENFDEERSPALMALEPYPRQGSGVVLYGFGNPWPPPGNQWFDDGMTDPHAYPRRLSQHNAQMVHFLRTGEIIDVCSGAPCRFPPPN